MRLRVMVYNVKAFRRGVRGIAALVAEHGPDVALVQECGPRHRLHHFPKESGLSPRGALIIRMGRSGFRVWVASIHLGLHPGARRRNADELTSLLPPLGGAILAGTT